MGAVYETFIALINPFTRFLFIYFKYISNSLIVIL